MVLLPESDFLVRRVQVEGENLGHEFTRIRAGLEFPSVSRVHDTEWMIRHLVRYFCRIAHLSYILVKLKSPSKQLVHPLHWRGGVFFFFRQIGWKIWRLGVWADAKQVPFMATCASVTPQCCFFFSQGWRSSMAWIAQAGGWTEEIPNSHPGMVDKTLWIYNGTQVYLPNFNWSSTGEPDFWTIDSRWARNCGKDWLLGSLGVFWDFQMDFRHRLCVDQAFCWKACFAGSESM